MKITTWNARGLNAPSKKRLLKRNLTIFDSDIILIQETKLNRDEGMKLSQKLGRWKSELQHSQGASGGLGIIWNPRQISTELLSSQANWMGARINSSKTDLKIIIINVYGPTPTADKLAVWKEISAFIKTLPPEIIIIGGDFNAISSKEEKQGGNTQACKSMGDFKEWIQKDSLMDIKTKNGMFTWNNRRKGFCYIAERLDRFLLKGELSQDKMATAEILPMAGSDHFPVKLEIKEQIKPSRNPFKCEKMWFQDKTFMNHIKEWWQEEQFEGSKMFCLVSKLKSVKEKILKWNNQHFKNIFKEKLEIEEKLNKINKEIIKKGMNNESFMLEKEYLHKHEEILAKEEIFWRQKSREKWLLEGDRNTKFFHNSTLSNRNHINITKIKNSEGEQIENPVEIVEILIKHFSNTLNNYEFCNKPAQEEMLKFIPKLITEEDNKFLSESFTLQEVKTALFSMNPDKSPGPDGFQAFFFQQCWDILGEELWKALEATRNGGSILTEINHTFLTLIPKKSNSIAPGEFRPIALCNTIYKVYSKILANRLKIFLPKLISEEQTGFVPGRSIYDGISIIQETIHSAIKNKEACMFLKLDIQKAYDKVDWRFLCKTLEAFGFSKQWINIIHQCISTPKISILVNGTPEGFFNISRGIRQGDPISPFLFIIMAEAFGRAIKKTQTDNMIKGVRVTKEVENTTHQQFADDTILAGISTLQEANNFKHILDTYTKASGQMINAKKSEIYFLNTVEEVEDQICNKLGFKKGKFPFKYLGIYLDKNNYSNPSWEHNLKKIDNQTESWKGRWLTKAGRMTKIKAVLSAIPIYQLSCSQLPKNINSKLERKLRDFFWNGLEEKKKATLISWCQICKPKEYGGLGIKNLEWQNEALGAKQVWRLYHESDRKWAKILYNKYLNPLDKSSLFRIKNPPKGSAGWNFMAKSRNLITKYLTWDLGKGEEALFWEDSWNGLPPLTSYDFAPETISFLKTLRGTKVKDYIEELESNLDKKWKWKPLPKHGITLSDKEKLENILKDRFSSIRDREDKLIWAASKDGKYKVKEGYRMITNSLKWEISTLPLELCWDPAGLPKAGIFLWAAMQKRILTADRIRKMGFEGPSRCILCKEAEENPEHLLYACKVSQECWRWLQSKLNWTSPLASKWIDHLLGWPKNASHKIYGKLWNISPAIVLWEIWKERNRRLFQNQSLSEESLYSKIEVAISEVMNSDLRKRPREEGSFSEWDAEIKKRWPLLINPPLLYKKKNNIARLNCKWEPPPPGWIKLNFDGASRGNPGKAGIGCIIRDEYGNRLVERSKPLAKVTNNMAELEAVKEGINLSIKLKIKKLMIEGDSQIIINALRKGVTPNWVLNSKLENIIKSLSVFEDIRFIHIFREGNKEADKLANLGTDGINTLHFNRITKPNTRICSS